MSLGPLTFRQRDLTRALKAAKAAGHQVSHYEIARDGTIRIVLATKSIHDSGDAATDQEIIL